MSKWLLLRFMNKCNYKCENRRYESCMRCENFYAYKKRMVEEKSIVYADTSRAGLVRQFLFEYVMKLMKKC